MKQSFFKFKQFTIHQDKAAMKVCTDACLLGALATYPTPKTILDIGAGTGLLSFMLAQKYPQAQITAVENEPQAISQMDFNLSINPTFQTQIQVVPRAIQEFIPPDTLFDGIVCNPPFYTDHLVSPVIAKRQAHHQETLTSRELISQIKALLAPGGSAWILLPPHEMQRIEPLILEFSLSVHQKIRTRHSPKHPISREYWEIKKEKAKLMDETEFPIYESNSVYHPRFKKLLQDYYLIF